jgi:hypothetical protein
MNECLPTLRRLGDQRCTGRALYVLGALGTTTFDTATPRAGTCPHMMCSSAPRPAGRICVTAAFRIPAV